MTTHAGIPWWSLDTLLPPEDRRVAVRWRDRRGYRVLEAARAWCKEAGQVLWLTVYKGRLVWLPLVSRRPADEQRHWVGFHNLVGADPELWRPLDLASWPEALPAPDWLEPVEGGPGSVRPGRMWASTLFAASDSRSGSRPDAAGSRPEGASAQVRGNMSASDIARELEEMREAAHAAHRAGRGRPPSLPPEPQWWLDSHLVTYSPPGRISRREAEGRLMRALATDRRTLLARPRVQTFAAVLAGLCLPSPCEPGMFQPTGADCDDAVVALAWLPPLALLTGAAGERARQASAVLAARAELPALSWATIADRAGVAVCEVAALYAAALDRVTAVANGAATPAVLARAAALAAVREANRAHRRRVVAG